MAKASALSACGGRIVPPLAPMSPAWLEPVPTTLKPHEYIWEGLVREWVSAPPIWMGATPKQEKIYPEFWRQQHLQTKREEGKKLEEWEKDANAEEEVRRGEALAAGCSHRRTTSPPSGTQRSPGLARRRP
ncbi:Pre-mRNA-processing factor 39 [Hordeum vulgare]|nr:Pre-mRNA-processing factor 39 [Hordeum vulgare]